MMSAGIMVRFAPCAWACNGSVQVMLFADRLEMLNPGTLPASLTLEKLRQPHGSVPAELLYLTRYIERMGTGTGDMIRRCLEAGLKEPGFAIRDGFLATIWRQPVASGGGQPESQPESRPESLELRVLELLRSGAFSKAELFAGLGQKEVYGQLNKVIRLLLAEQSIEFTIPDKPNSRLQKILAHSQGQNRCCCGSSRNGVPMIHPPGASESDA